MANECIALYEPGQDITGLCSTAVTGKRFVNITATRDATTGLIVVGNAAAAGRIFGVAAYDAAINARVAIKRGKGIIIPVTAGAAIAFNTEVEVDASQRAVAKAAGVAVGRTVEAAAGAGVDVFIELY